VTRLIIATRSSDKLREIEQILAHVPGLATLDLNAAGVEPDPQEDAIEIFQTFRENALAKARYYAARSGELVLADDSGLCVDALDGAPGVRSKRFSGRDDLSGSALDLANNQLLLRLLHGIPAEQRTARYTCAIALVDPGSGSERDVHGSCEGLILDRPRGSNGFGYDPLFYSVQAGITFGELAPELKNRISHRARAVRAAAEILPGWLQTLAHASSSSTTNYGKTGR
jgi:XTP/dITP diphosphohydrolase